MKQKTEITFPFLQEFIFFVCFSSVVTHLKQPAVPWITLLVFNTRFPMRLWESQRSCKKVTQRQLICCYQTCPLPTALPGLQWLQPCNYPQGGQDFVNRLLL